MTEKEERKNIGNQTKTCKKKGWENGNKGTSVESESFGKETSLIQLVVNKQ